MEETSYKEEKEEVQIPEDTQQEEEVEELVTEEQEKVQIVLDEEVVDLELKEVLFEQGVDKTKDIPEGQESEYGI